MREASEASPESVTGVQHGCANTTFAEFPDSALELSLSARFEQQVAAHRDCLAVRDRGRSLSYGELDSWANGIAQAILTRRGDAPGRVALVLGQGASYAAAVLGVLKSGKTYVPLDPSEPAARLAGFAAAADVDLVVTDAESSARAAAIEERGMAIDVGEVTSGVAPDLAVSPDAIAYVFFTSGSTGEPKGVYDTHRNVLHNVLRYTNALQISPADRLSLLQGPAYSGCVSSLFGALLNGAASFPFRLAEGLGTLAGWVTREGITIYHSVPSILRALVGAGDTFPGVRVIRLEGDRASSADVELLRTHFSPTCVLANGLGTTETGLARQLLVRAHDVVEDGILPVGYPVEGVEVAVVDDSGMPVRTGAVGEISVRSRYLALGYWERPDLTSRAFTPNPDADAVRSYRTGDLGRLRADGCLEYLGRRDESLKVLGHRVEPAEVESELLRLPGVREAVVSTRDGRKGEGRLVGYVVPGAGGAPSFAAMRQALEERLPSYMLPTALVELEALPVGASGKVDRQALPEPAQPGGDARAGGDDIELGLVALWEDVLDVRTIGVDDDFFALGGDSLAAAEILARIESDTGRALPLSVLAGAPTIARLAALVRAGSPRSSSSLAVLRADGARAPLVLLHGNTGHSLHYSDLVRRLDADRPLWALEDALPADDVGVDAIAARHVGTLEVAGAPAPYVLAGFCYGAVLARELAGRLRARGQEVALLVLLGVTPLEFPSVLAPGVSSRWLEEHGPSAPFRSRVRRHVGRARELPVQERPRYLSRRGTSLVRRALPRNRASIEASAGLVAIQHAVAAYRPKPYLGRALLVLHEAEAAEYTDNPERAWAGLATGGVEVELLPGRDHAMLEEPGAARLAALLQARLASLP